jgi:hypothetical protein
MADEIKLTEAQRLSLVRKLWMLHPVHGDTEVVNFYQEMETDHAELLRRGPGDDYQRLRADLTGLINQAPEPTKPAS